MSKRGYYQKLNVILAEQAETDGVVESVYSGFIVYEPGDYLARQGVDTWVIKKDIFEKTYGFVAADLPTVHALGFKTLPDLDPVQADAVKNEALLR